MWVLVTRGVSLTYTPRHRISTGSQTLKLKTSWAQYLPILLCHGLFCPSSLEVNESHECSTGCGFHITAVCILCGRLGRAARLQPTQFNIEIIIICHNFSLTAVTTCFCFNIMKTQQCFYICTLCRNIIFPKLFTHTLYSKCKTNPETIHHIVARTKMEAEAAYTQKRLSNSWFMVRLGSSLTKSSPHGIKREICFKKQRASIWIDTFSDCPTLNSTETVIMRKLWH